MFPTFRHPAVSRDQDLAVPSADPDIRISPGLIGSPFVEKKELSFSEGMKMRGKTPLRWPLNTLTQALLSFPSSRSVEAILIFLQVDNDLEVFQCYLLFQTTRP